MKPLLLSKVVLLLMTSGCARPTDARHPKDAVATENGGRHEPASEEERAILELVATLPENVREKVGDRTLSASRVYHAASGYSCRDVTIEDGKAQSRRLACGDDDGWFFVPDVYGTEQPKAREAQAEVKLSPTGAATAVESRASTRTPDGLSDTAPSEKAGP